MIVDIGIFAHNEEQAIGHLLQSLSQQSLIGSGEHDVRIEILANGCTDATVKICHETLDKLQASNPEFNSKLFEIRDIVEGGKSRTWNNFVHQSSRAEADFLVFMDADIQLTSDETLSLLVQAMATRNELRAISSRPVKDLALAKHKLTLTEKMITSAGGTLEDAKAALTSICGQLYIAKTEAVRTIHMPIGLPVEDGFLRAMILTDLLTADEDLTRIDGIEEVWHTYESIRTVNELIQHQTRIVIGSAINHTLFKHIRSHHDHNPVKAQKLLQEAAHDEQWLGDVIRQSLPQFPYGYVPFHYLTKRVNSMFKGKITPKKLFIALVGFSFDFLVWLRSNYTMSRGKGVGYW